MTLWGLAVTSTNPILEETDILLKKGNINHKNIKLFLEKPLEIKSEILNYENKEIKPMTLKLNSTNKEIKPMTLKLNSKNEEIKNKEIKTLTLKIT